MKIIDIAKTLDKSKQNEDYVDLSVLTYEFGVNKDCYVEQNRLKSYWVGNWCCTDTWVGYKIYYLDDIPVCFSIQKGRKSDEVFKWFNKDLAIKTKEYILSLVSKENEDYFEICDTEEDIGDTYKIHFNNQVTDWSKATLNGKEIKFIQRIRFEGDFGIDSEVKIEVEGQEKIVNIKDLDFKFHVI